MKLNFIGTDTRKTIWAVVIVYALLGFAVYSNVIINGTFIFDDFEYIVGNSMVQDLSSLLLDVSDPRQVGYMTFALNYAISGDDPVGFHLTNVVVHIANAVVVFLLVRFLLFALSGFNDAPVMSHFATAFISGLVFLVHPLQTQAVSYVTQRFTSLTAFFYLLSLFLYLAARFRFEKNNPARSTYAMYFFSVFIALLAMKTKEIAFTLPFTISVLELLLFRNSVFSNRRFFHLIPFWAATVIIPLSIFGPEMGLISQGEGIAEITRKEKIYDLFERSAYEYLCNQLRIIVIYIGKLVLPVKLQVIHDIKASRTFFDFKVIRSLVFLTAFAFSAVYMWFKASKRSSDEAAYFKLYSIGVFWFFVTISIESSFIPIKDLIFEHRVYLPSVGFIAGLCGLAVSTVERRILNYLSLNKIVWFAVAVITALSVGTYVRNDVWTDEIKFWADVVKKTPDKAIGYHNRGNAYAKIGQHEKALADIDKTISYFPSVIGKKLSWEVTDFTPTNMAKTYMNRASIYRHLGEMEKADADFLMAKKLVDVPMIDFDATKKLADMYYRKGAYRHAVEEYSKVLLWNPDDADMLNDRGNAYSSAKRFNEAVADFTRAIAVRPDYMLAYYNRGIAYAFAGDKKAALADLEVACKAEFKPACAGIELVKK
ncbi:MAG: tetratricopeptide repeat protein [Nitrospirae bacterium]|nr:MAG: tetratricopeptide repeat protein [Nitrospirota bacterium]